MLAFGVCEGVGVGAGFDEVAAEGETVDDRGTEPRVSESFCSSGECFVGGDRDAVAMAGNASHYVVHAWEVQEQRIDVDGDCAAVLQRIDLHANVIGEGRNGYLSSLTFGDYTRRPGGFGGGTQPPCPQVRCQAAHDQQITRIVFDSRS